MHQDGFHLVIGVVPHHDSLGAMLPREIEQKAISAQTRRFFYAEFVLGSELPHILSFKKERQPQFSHMTP